MKQIIITLIMNSIIFQSVYASDCLSRIESTLPQVNLPNTNIEMSTNSNFCFDSSNSKNKNLLAQFEELKKINAIDEKNCIADKKFDYDTNLKISEFITNAIRESVSVYTDDIYNISSDSKIIFTNSTNSNFVRAALIKKDEKIDLTGRKFKSEKLDMKDTAEIAGAAISSSLIGTIIERRTDGFRNKNGSLQHDKLLHTNMGTLINLGSVAGAYLVIETAGVGNKLNLTKNQKKWAILLTGTVVGLLVGYGKERFYDYYHQDIHTYDPHLKGDMGATWLGAGGLNVLTGSLTFKF